MRVHFIFDTSFLGLEKTDYANITCSVQPGTLTYPAVLILALSQNKVIACRYWEKKFESHKNSQTIEKENQEHSWVWRECLRKITGRNQILGRLSPDLYP